MYLENPNWPFLIGGSKSAIAKRIKSYRYRKKDNSFWVEKDHMEKLQR